MRPKTAVGGQKIIQFVEKENWNTQANRSFGKTPQLSPTKQGLINLDLIQKEVQNSMRMEEMKNPDPVVQKFNSFVHQSVQRYTFRPYSRQGVNNNCDWDKGR